MVEPQHRGATLIERTIRPRGTAPEREYILALVQRQGQTPDPEFAASLGVSVNTWRGTRTGKMGLGLKLLLGSAEMVSHSLYAAAQESVIRRERGRPSRRDSAA